MAHNRIGIREFVELTVRTGDLNPVTSNSNNTAMIGRFTASFKQRIGNRIMKKKSI